MDIPLPPGYRGAAVFDKSQHRRLGVASDAAAFARSLGIIFLTTAEVPRAALDYPVVFIRDAADTIVPVGVVGVEPGANLFIDARNEWDAAAYCPAYVRRYPFFTANVKGDDARRLICVDDSALINDGQELLNALGELTPRFREIEKLIEEFDREQEKTVTLCRYLTEWELLESFDADFHPQGKPQKRMSGMLRVREESVQKLDAERVVQAAQSGLLKVIYAHILSSQRFDRILNRYADS